MKIQSSSRMRTRFDNIHHHQGNPVFANAVWPDLEPLAQPDITAPPWHGPDPGHPAHVCFGAKEHAGTHHQFYVSS